MEDNVNIIPGCIVLLLVMLVCLGLSITHLSITNDSQHTGYITAVQLNGLIWPNYEVYVKTDSSSSQEDTYCLPRESALATVLKEAQEQRKLVTVHYRGMRAIGVGICDGEYIVDVKEATK